eukprot:2071878-Prymnesium_polylepis.5
MVGFLQPYLYVVSGGGSITSLLELELHVEVKRDMALECAVKHTKQRQATGTNEARRGLTRVRLAVTVSTVLPGEIEQRSIL